MANLGREAILEAVHELPAEERLDLVRSILAETDGAEAARLAEVTRQLAALHAWIETRPRAERGVSSAAALRGIARMDAPPDDETVARWLDEHRMEKYGG